MTLNRHPTGEEKVRIKTLQTKGAIVKGEAPATATPTPKTPAPKPAPVVTPKGNPGKGNPKAPLVATGVVLPTSPNDVTFYQDLLWALMNTNEFMLNH